MTTLQNIRSEIFFGIFILLFFVCEARADQSLDQWTQVLSKVFSTGSYADYAALLHPNCPKSDKDQVRFQMIQDIFKKEGSPQIQSEPYTETAAASGAHIRFAIKPSTSFYFNRTQEQKPSKFQMAVGVQEKEKWFEIGSGCAQEAIAASFQTAAGVSAAVEAQSTQIAGAVSGAQPAQTAGTVSGSPPPTTMPKPSVQSTQAAASALIVQPQLDGVSSQKFSFQFTPKDPMWPLEWHLRISDEEAQRTSYDLVLEEVKEQGAVTVAVLIASKWIQAKEGDPVEFRFFINLDKAAPDGTFPFGFSRIGNTAAKNKVKAYAQKNWFSAALGIRNTSDIEIKKEANGGDSRVELVRFKSLIKDQTKQFTISLLKKAL